MEINQSKIGQTGTPHCQCRTLAVPTAVVYIVTPTTLEFPAGIRHQIRVVLVFRMHEAGVRIRCSQILQQWLSVLRGIKMETINFQVA